MIPTNFFKVKKSSCETTEPFNKKGHNQSAYRRPPNLSIRRDTNKALIEDHQAFQ